MKTKELIAELRHTAETMQILGDFAKADLLTRAADYIEGNHLQRGEWKEAEKMSQEKQIEEMAKIIASSCYKSCSECNSEAIDGTACIEVRSAEALYNAGYRKQIEGEWIRDTTSKFYHRYNCSVCNYRLVGEPTKFCPDCGVHM